MPLDSTKFGEARRGELKNALCLIREDQPMRREAADAICRVSFMPKEIADAQP